MGLQEAEQLAIYFEEVAVAEKKKIREAQSTGKTNTSGDDWHTLGPTNEEYAFEDPDQE